MSIFEVVSNAAFGVVCLTLGLLSIVALSWLFDEPPQSPDAQELEAAKQRHPAGRALRDGGAS